jgi:hypothetical protein
VPFGITLFAYFQRGRQVDLNEILAQASYKIPGYDIGGNKRSNHKYTMPFKHAGKVTDPSYMTIPLCFIKAGLRKDFPDFISVQMFCRAPHIFEDPVYTTADGAFP